MLQLFWPKSTERVTKCSQVEEVQVAHVPTTLLQETGDHNPELGWGWRPQDKERSHGEVMDGQLLREGTSATGFFIIKT